MRGEGRKCFTGRSGVLLINLYCAGFRLKDGRKKGTQKKKKRKKSTHDRIASFSRLEGTGRNKKVTEKGVGDKGDVGRRDVRQAAPVGPPRASAFLVFHLPFLTLVSQSLPLPLPLSLFAP